MAMDISKSKVGDMTNDVDDFEVAADQVDSATDQKETKWMNTFFTTYLGYYRDIPELKSTIDTKAKWVIGKGYQADKKTKKVFDKIKGWGKDTFNTILQNMVRTYYVGGDSFAEIIKDKGKLVNVKPLNPESIAIIANKEGIVLRYEQIDRQTKQTINSWKPEEMFHLAKNRFADEIHGTSIIRAIENIILARNEAITDMKTVFHRYVKPLWVWQLDTDDETKIKEFKTKADKTVANSENIYIPKGAAEAERVSVPQYSTLDPLPWIQDLTDYFYQATNTPDVVVGSAKQTVEASAKILFLGFEQSVRDDQMFVIENVKSQLGFDIKLEFPTPIEADLLQDTRKDGDTTKTKPSDTTAELEGTK